MECAGGRRIQCAGAKKRGKEGGRKLLFLPSLPLTPPSSSFALAFYGCRNSEIEMVGKGRES